MKKIVITLVALFSFYVLAYNPKEAFDLVKEGKGIFVDVREENEVKEGMIENAIWFPLSRFESQKNWKEEFLKLTKGKKIFLYCRSGARSGRVKSILKEVNVESENIGGYMTLGTILPTKKP
jgi:phage shock protein E